MSFPRRSCVRVNSLRSRGYQDLKDWMSNEDNILVTRHGRLFVVRNKEKHIFHYPSSEWANPFKVNEHGLEECLLLYEDHLLKKLNNIKAYERFKKLRTAKEIGCFCEESSPCHVDIILKFLRQIYPSS